MPEAPDDPTSPTTDTTDTTDDDAHGSLRGTLVAVMSMAAFFAIVWFGMLWLALERR